MTTENQEMVEVTKVRGECDACEKYIETVDVARMGDELRGVLRQWGWQAFIDDDGVNVDLCPGCFVRLKGIAINIADKP